VTTPPASESVRVRRLPDRGAYDAATIHPILDEAPFAHVGITVDGQPFVIPTIHARIDETLYLHGSPASRLLRTAKGPTRVCVTVSIVDGLVLARSAFHHSMNYRSVVVLGDAVEVTDEDEKMRAFEALVEQVCPGRWEGCRIPNAKEINSTLVVKLALTEASAKVRTGGPVDDAEDLGLDVWAGVVPVSAAFGVAEPATDLGDGIGLPDHVAALGR